MYVSCPWCLGADILLKVPGRDGGGLVAKLCRTLATLWTIACQALCPWDFPGKNTRVSCHALLQGIFPTQGSNPGLPHCRWILYHPNHQGSPIICQEFRPQVGRVIEKAIGQGIILQKALSSRSRILTSHGKPLKVFEKSGPLRDVH